METRRYHGVVEVVSIVLQCAQRAAGLKVFAAARCK